MLDLVDTMLRTTVIITAITNFAMLVFFYRRDTSCRRKMLYAASALGVAIGQLSVAITTFKGREVDWPEAAMQIGLALALLAASGSIKKLMNILAYHQIGGAYAYRRRRSD